MLTLTTPVAVSYTQVRARSLTVTDVPSLQIAFEIRDSAGNTDGHRLAFDAIERQKLVVLPSGRIGVGTEASPPGYPASLLATFAGAAGGVAAKLRALETKLRDDGLLLAGAIS